VKRKRAGEVLVETNRGIDLLAELFERIGGARREAGKAADGAPWVPEGVVIMSEGDAARRFLRSSSSWRLA